MTQVQLVAHETVHLPNTLICVEHVPAAPVRLHCVEGQESQQERGDTGDQTTPAATSPDTSGDARHRSDRKPGGSNSQCLEDKNVRSSRPAATRCHRRQQARPIAAVKAPLAP